MNLKEAGISFDPNDTGTIKIVKQRARMALKRAWRSQMRIEPTPAEKALKVALRGLGVNFTHQAIVHGFIPDFWCEAFSLIVEVDGTSHNGRLDYDDWRDEIFRRKGIEVVRVSNLDALRYPATCLAKVERAMRIQAAGFSDKRKKRLLSRCAGIARRIVEK